MQFLVGASARSPAAVAQHASLARPCRPHRCVVLARCFLLIVSLAAAKVWLLRSPSLHFLDEQHALLGASLVNYRTRTLLEQLPATQEAPVRLAPGYLLRRVASTSEKHTLKKAVAYELLSLTATKVHRTTLLLPYASSSFVRLLRSPFI